MGVLGGVALDRRRDRVIPTYEPGTGRGAVWLARLNGVQEVGGSNPLGPTQPKAGRNNQLRPAFYFSPTPRRLRGLRQWERAPTAGAGDRRQRPQILDQVGDPQVAVQVHRRLDGL